MKGAASSASILLSNGNNALHLTNFRCEKFRPAKERHCATTRPEHMNAAHPPRGTGQAFHYSSVRERGKSRILKAGSRSSLGFRSQRIEQRAAATSLA